jgi:hypothetical protein
MTEYEWVQRARMQYARRTGDFMFDWLGVAKTAYDETLEDFENDPEDAADCDMSYWDDDGE